LCVLTGGEARAWTTASGCDTGAFARYFLAGATTQDAKGNLQSWPLPFARFLIDMLKRYV
jgi:hypothetical protein